MPNEDENDNLTSNHPGSKPNYWDKPVGKIIIGVTGSLIAGTILVFIGFAINHYILHDDEKDVVPIEHKTISPPIQQTVNTPDPINVEMSFSPVSAVLGKVAPRLNADGSSGPNKGSSAKFVKT